METKSQTNTATRDRIIAAATDQFLAHGFEQTTTRDIAKALNITQPALYHYFGDKETLFVEVIKVVGQQVADEMLAILAQPYPQPVDQLVDMTKVIVNRHPRDVFTLIHGSFDVLSPDSKQTLGMVFGRYYVGPIASFFDQEAMQLRQHVDAKMASAFYMTSLAPLFSDFHALTDARDLTTRVQNLLDLILYGVAHR